MTILGLAVVSAMVAFAEPGQTGLSPSRELAPAVAIEAGGQPISVDIGHAHPFVADFDGDGVKDLLVGQFGEGTLRIYRNVGTNAAPRFEDFEWFQAGGQTGRVPSG